MIKFSNQGNKPVVPKTKKIKIDGVPGKRKKKKREVAILPIKRRTKILQRSKKRVLLPPLNQRRKQKIKKMEKIGENPIRESPKNCELTGLKKENALAVVSVGTNGMNVLTVSALESQKSQQ
jgi:hypothetical protein